MSASFSQILDAIREGDIVPPASLEAVMRGDLADDTTLDSRVLLDRLLKQQLLTRYQVDCLAEGNGERLRLGQYIILDEIGRGGMGVVLKARQTSLDRIVAVKVLTDDRSLSRKDVSRFQREFLAHGRLSHPNIVAAHDAGCDKGLYYLVMEYVEGVNLASDVRTNGPLSVTAACNVVLQAAEGLSYAHQQGVIHRDVKPSNLMRTANGTVKILDLGLATLYAARQPTDGSTSEELTHTGEIFGTVDFMAPEQATDPRSADARSDIYSLGCTLFFLLTGRPVHERDDRIHRIKARHKRSAPSLQSVHAQLPERLDRIFARMIATDPEDRYPSMDEVAKDLRKLEFDSGPGSPAEYEVGRADLGKGSTEPTVAFDSGSTERLPTTETERLTRSRSVLAAGIGAVALAVLGLFFWLNSDNRKEPANGTSRDESKSSSSAGKSNSRMPDVPMRKQPAADVDRAVAQWVLQVGGSMQIAHAGGGEEEVPDLAALPDGKFAVTAVYLLSRAKLQEGFAIPNRLPERLKHVQFCNRAVTDESLAPLASAKALEIVNLNKSSVQGPGLRHLVPCKRLRELELIDTPVTDDSLAALADLKQLKDLDVGNTSIGDGTLKHLRGLTNLERLRLDVTRVTNAGLDNLKMLQNLYYLSLHRTKIGDDGLQHLVGFPKLTTLVLSETAVTSQGCRQIARLASLQELYLDRTRITDEGLTHLSKLNGLRVLSIEGTKVSAAAVAEFKKQHPRCAVLPKPKQVR